MAKQYRLYWTLQAKQDLLDIREHISRDAPLTARAFVRRLRDSLARLKTFPHSGQVVPELGNPSVREVLRGSYRVIYRVGPDRVDVLTVFHSARLLDDSEF